MSHQVKIEKNRCIGCGLCVKTCVANNIEVIEGKAKIKLDNCLMCGQCQAICPKEAVTLSGFDFDVIKKRGEHRLNPDEVLEAIRFRRSIRQFKEQKIPEDVIKQILEAGRLTHTAKNKQDVSYVVLDKEKDKIEKMAVSLFKKVKPFANLVSPMARLNEIHDHFFFFKAPIVIVILAKEKTNGILAAQNMEFVAEAHGLGVLYSGFFSMSANLSRKIKKQLHVPKGKKVVATLVLGYPSVKYLRSPLREKLECTYL